MVEGTTRNANSPNLIDVTETISDGKYYWLFFSIVNQGESHHSGVTHDRSFHVQLTPGTYTVLIQGWTGSGWTPLKSEVVEYEAERLQIDWNRATRFHGWLNWGYKKLPIYAEALETRLQIRRYANGNPFGYAATDGTRYTTYTRAGNYLYRIFARYNDTEGDISHVGFTTKSTN